MSDVKRTAQNPVEIGTSKDQTRAKVPSTKEAKVTPAKIALAKHTQPTNKHLYAPVASTTQTPSENFAPKKATRIVNQQKIALAPIAATNTIPANLPLVESSNPLAESFGQDTGTTSNIEAGAIASQSGQSAALQTEQPAPATTKRRVRKKSDSGEFYTSPIRFQYYSDSSGVRSARSGPYQGGRSMIQSVGSDTPQQYDRDEDLANLECSRGLYCMGKALECEQNGDDQGAAVYRRMQAEAASISLAHIEKHRENAIKKNTEAYAFLNKAACESMIGKPKDAVASIQKFLQANEGSVDSSWPVTDLATMLFANRQYAEAQQVLEQSITLAKNSNSSREQTITREARALGMLAEIARLQGDTVRANKLKAQFETIGKQTPKGYFTSCMASDFEGLGLELPANIAKFRQDERHNVRESVTTTVGELLTPLADDPQRLPPLAFATQRIDADFFMDGTLAEITTYGIDPSGYCYLHTSLPGKNYDNDNQRAFLHFKSAVTAENTYLGKIASLKPGEVIQNDSIKIHESALKSAKLAVSALSEHLQRTDRTSTVYKFNDHEIDLLDSGRGAAACTYANMAICHAILGDRAAAQKCLEEVQKTCADKQITAEAIYEVATAFIAHGDLQTSRKMLYQTVGNGGASWTSEGMGPSRNLKTWVIIAEIEKHLGNKTACQKAHSHIAGLLPSVYGFVVRNELTEMGLMTLEPEWQTKMQALNARSSTSEHGF